MMPRQRSQTLTVDAYRDQQAAEMTEKELLDLVRQAARQLGWLTFHCHDSRRSEPGFPDLVAIYKAPMIGQPSRILVAELKTMTGVVSREQMHWLACFGVVDIPAFVWHPDDWVDGTILRVLRGLGPGEEMT